MSYRCSVESVQGCISVRDDNPISYYPNALLLKTFIPLYSWLPSKKMISCPQIPKYVTIFFWPNTTEWTPLERAYFLCFDTKGSFKRIGQALKGLRESQSPCLPANPSQACCFFQACCSGSLSSIVT